MRNSKGQFVKGAGKNGKDFNCQTCGDEFYRSQWYIKKGKTSYCSPECQYEGYKNRVTLTCKQCDDDFRVKKYREETAKFCSRSCSAQWNMSGERHHNWKGGDRPYENLEGYDALHRWVEKQKGKPGKCENCGQDGFGSQQIDWANKSGEYKKEVSDWLRLCRK